VLEKLRQNSRAGSIQRVSELWDPIPLKTDPMREMAPTARAKASDLPDRKKTDGQD